MQSRHDSVVSTTSIDFSYLSDTPSANLCMPSTVWRVQRPSAQTKYTRADGFTAKNTKTILSQGSSIHKFITAHLSRATNISSPFISAYDSEAHALRMAEHWSIRYNEVIMVVEIDTTKKSRGPPFRACDYVEDARDEMHYGEYLFMYKIPPEAIVEERSVGGVARLDVMGLSGGVWGGRQVW